METATFYSRDVHLDAAELEVVQGLIVEMDDSDGRDWLTVVLNTGLRHSNAGGLRWSWLALNRAELRIPHTDHKGGWRRGADLVLPLAPAVVEHGRATARNHGGPWGEPQQLYSEVDGLPTCAYD